MRPWGHDGLALPLETSGKGRSGPRSLLSVPAWRPPELAAAPQLAPRPQMGVVLTRGLFGEDDGQIQWYGVIASTNASREC